MNSDNFAVGNKVIWLDPQTELDYKATIKQVFKSSAKIILSNLQVVTANLKDLKIAPLEKPRTPPKFPEKIDISLHTEQAITYLDLSEIRIDGGTQQRVGCHQQHIFSLVDALSEEAELDPITVFFDGVHHWLVDGFHRYFAYKSEGREIIPAHVSPGTQRDAILSSIAANAEHRALPRTRADKRKAVETLLLDKEWGQWSDREIARQAKVDHKTVAAVRKVLNDFVEGNLSVGNSPLTKDRKFVSKHGTVATLKSSESEEDKPPQLSFPKTDDLESDFKKGDRVVSTYSPNLEREVVGKEPETDLLKVKWNQGSVSHANPTDLKKATPISKSQPIEIDLKEVILGFTSNLDRLSAEQIRDVFINSLDRLSEEQVKELFQACVKRLGQLKEATKCQSA